VIEEDRPRILASGRSPDMNMYPFDQPGDVDEHNELFLIHSGEIYLTLKIKSLQVSLKLNLS